MKNVLQRWEKSVSSRCPVTTSPPGTPQGLTVSFAVGFVFPLVLRGFADLKVSVWLESRVAPSLPCLCSSDRSCKIRTCSLSKENAFASSWLIHFRASWGITLYGRFSPRFFYLDFAECSLFYRVHPALSQLGPPKSRRYRNISRRFGWKTAESQSNLRVYFSATNENSSLVFCVSQWDVTVPRVVANISPVLSYYSAVQLIIYKRVLFMATVMVNYYLLDYVRIGSLCLIDWSGLEAFFFLVRFLFFFHFFPFAFSLGDLLIKLVFHILCRWNYTWEKFV